MAALRISGRIVSTGARLGVRACAGGGLGFCLWTAVSSDLKLLLVSLGFLILTVPLWLGVRAAKRVQGAATRSPAG